MARCDGPRVIRQPVPRVRARDRARGRHAALNWLTSACQARRPLTSNGLRVVVSGSTRRQSARPSVAVPKFLHSTFCVRKHHPTRQFACRASNKSVQLLLQDLLELTYTEGRRSVNNTSVPCRTYLARQVRECVHTLIGFTPEQLT